MKHVKELDQNDISQAIRQYVEDNDYVADRVEINITSAYHGDARDSSPASVSAKVTLKEKPMNPIRAEWGDQH